MTDPSAGIVVAVKELPASRREVTVTTGVVGLHKLTLMPGVLGTPDGEEVIRRASDLVAVTYAVTHPRAARVPTPPEGG